LPKEGKLPKEGNKAKEAKVSTLSNSNYLPLRDLRIWLSAKSGL